MATFPSFRGRLRSTLLALVATVLGTCPPCAAEPVSPAGRTRGLPGAGNPRPAPPSRAVPSRMRPSQPRYPDPRYRPPAGFAELQAVAGQVAKATGHKIHWRLEPGKNPGPLVTIRGGLENCIIAIHPVAARIVPPNTWAFIFGHEFAHLVQDLGTHTNPAIELKADIAGARYAMAAGYRIEAFLGWVLTEKNQPSASHGSLRDRVHAIAAHFRVPNNVIQKEARRYRRDARNG